MRIINKIMGILKPFLITVMLFIASGLIFKTIETIVFCKYQDSVSFFTIIQSYINIITVFSLYSVIVLPLYILTGFIHKKISQILISIVFAILIALEIGLFIYSKQTGVLMGTELIIRPSSEIWTTIQNSSNIIIDIVSIIAVCACFIALPFALKKIKILNSSRSLSTGLIIIGTLSAMIVFYQKDKNQTINNYIESKSYYFFYSIVNYTVEEPEIEYFIIDEEGYRIEKDENMLKKYISLFNNKSVADLEYPMERPASEFPDILSPFFKKSEKQPNIVIIIVESLDSYLMNDPQRDISFIPFLDSLANVGLYWKNCLSTTSRTYGVLPSVIGSVPHGIKGFQFGIMPQHHSLFSILNNNNYYTNFFYGGDLNFDCMLDFVSKQEPNHIDNFLPQLKKLKKKTRANWWGVYDYFLFEESLNYLQTLFPKKPTVNVYLTITTHDPFTREDKKLKAYYDPKIEDIFAKLDQKQKKYFLPIKDRLAGYKYLDDGIRNFINNYSKESEFENTIFFITGDHSLGIHKNSLSHYSVPLIIWSPLLKTHKTFLNIISHLAITSSIISFLQNNYGIKTPERLAWSSLGLDTASVFKPAEKVLFLSYDRKVVSMVYNQYFLEKENNSNNMVYKINENLDLEEISDIKLIENMQSIFNTLKYVNNYVYHNDRLVQNNIQYGTQYELIKGYENTNTIVCKTPDTIPSIHGIDRFDLMPEQKIKGNYNKIKIKLMANIIINDFVYQDKQMMLNFMCLGKEYKNIVREHITKYILDENIDCNKKYELLIEKEFDVKEIEDISASVCVTSNILDYNWEPDKKITLSNIRVLIYGKK
jgi:uncharacterized sulfatase